MTGRQTLGAYEWVAKLRDGRIIHEFSGDTQKSADCLANLDVAELHLVPVCDGVIYTVIRACSDETIQKKWIRTFTTDITTGHSGEHPVIDAFTLVSNRQVNHYVFWHADKMILLITSSTEP